MSSPSAASMSAPSLSASEPAVPSPCRSLCKLNADEVCTGCGRTLNDIRLWRTMSDDERRVCVEQARQRRQAWGDAA